MNNLNKLISLEITIKSLKSIVKTKSLKATLWTEDAGIDSSELLLNLPSLKKKAKAKLKKANKAKDDIFKKIPKNKHKEIKTFLKEDLVIKDSFKIY